MKMEMWKKILAGVAVCSMAAGVASAATTVWNPAANGVVPPAVGDWADANWTAGVPLADQKTVFNVANAADCVVTTSDAVGGQLVMGDGGSATMNVLRIAAGGTLTTGEPDSDVWSAISYNRPAYCIVEAGGTFNTLARLGVGLVSDGDGLLEVYGDVSVIGNFQVAPGTGRKGRVNIFDGGTVSATGFEIGDDALIDLWQTGELYFSDIDTDELDGLIAAGKIMGNRLTNNLDVVVGIVDPGTTNAVTNATITATASIPNLAGLTEAEAADVLAVFGYVVGTTTEGSAPGGITGRVAASVPAAGSAPLAPGSSIDIIIQEAGEIPDVVGLEYAVATNLLVLSGYVIGTETETYVFDATPGLVTAQSPAGGTAANPGDAVSIDFYERLAPQSTITATAPGDWMTPNIWDLGVVPYKEVQNYEVRIANQIGTAVTVTNFVAMRRLQVGNGNPGQLDVLAGGHVVGAMYGDYVALGWNKDAVANVYAGGILESREALRIGWDGSSATVNIDGGSLIVDGWMSLGKSNKTNDLGVVYESEMTISNGGSVLCDRFRDVDSGGVTYQEGHITLASGTLATTGSDDVWIVNGLASGFIVIAEGYVSSQAVIDGNYTLSSRLPTYDGWATLWGVDLGSETEDYEPDGAENLLEYGLNGNPTNALDQGQNPVLTNMDGTLIYTHLSRADDTSLVYTVLTTDDLVNGTWTATGSSVIGTNITGEDYNVTTNEISTADSQVFVKLEISNP